MAKLISLFILASLLAPAAFAKNHEISDFHFSTCNGTRCVELWSATGQMSQLQFSFSTLGATRIRVFDKASSLDASYEGISSFYVPTLDCITLEQLNGASLVISLDTLKVETFAGKAKP